MSRFHVLHDADVCRTVPVEVVRILVEVSLNSMAPTKIVGAFFRPL
ncbi:hypothetical protein HMPREF0454_00726 [Hafnia alvei ATCC 51873]|uniref:Uncharacterized protein n=1 Tax=Hafnia alvei ATCC 51873 TaxID=1002364 RepID=G9Y2B4_HAFAL|nr:hypothetical protein HMPREF0454_00726 [Hafnia alvei ATCC 51873]